MNFIHYQPWTLMNRLHREIDQIFGENAAAAPAATPAASETFAAWTPAVDVHEEADRFVVRADLPGVESADIQITAEEGVLTIRGTRKAEERREKAGYERLERVTGSFLRRFTLPETVPSDAIKARHVNGVLELTLPKQAKPEPKRISIDVH
jgi:HSP20 family protein